MRRLHLIILLALVAVASASAKTKKQLVVLHTNDVHSCIMPLSENLDNKDLAGRGGFLRRINMIKEERKQILICCSSTLAISRRAQVSTHSSGVR